MRKFTFGAAAAASTLCVASAAWAVPTVNGSLDAEYGSPLAVQGNPTSFGDSNLASTNFANGSELDAGYARVSNGRLYIFLAGNLETNFNKLEVFIDSTAGGMNRLTPLATDQGGFNRMADDGSGNGLTFDSGFAADHWISMTSGGGTPDIFVDYANLDTATNGFFAGQTVPLNGTLTGGNGGPTIEATFNNANSTGVTGSTAPNDAATVGTGMEFSIALADLGPLGSEIRIAAMVNGGSHDFLSNQVLGSLPGSFGGNQLGEPRAVNFAQFDGAEYFTVPVPEPTTALTGLALLGLSVFRRPRRSH